MFLTLWLLSNYRRYCRSYEAYRYHCISKDNLKSKQFWNDLYEKIKKYPEIVPKDCEPEHLVDDMERILYRLKYSSRGTIMNSNDFSTLCLHFFSAYDNLQFASKDFKNEIKEYILILFKTFLLNGYFI